ncbi:MAG: fluoride efflux transporter CrcB [Myxococcales bacterium]|nr:fluoride efflux transporter CrcB [Myxococcales bacterium]
MNQLLLVVLGGGVGSGARFLVSAWMLDRFGASFPWGTFTVNVVGSFLLGVVMQLGQAGASLTPEARLFLTTGFMGGFTTYSTFNHETIRLLQGGSLVAAFGNVGLTLGSCLAAGALGVALVRWTQPGS